MGLLWAASYAGAAIGNMWHLIQKQVEEQFGYALVYIGFGIAGLIWFGIWCGLVSAIYI